MTERYWDVTLAYKGQEGRISGYGSAKDTEDAARVDRVNMTRYYEDLGYTIVESNLSNCCARCSGTGEVLAQRKRGGWIGKRVKCPVCKGKQSTVVVETMDDSAVVDSLPTLTREEG